MIARVLVVLAMLAAPAAAETKSFAAVKARLPPSTATVLGIDVKALRADPAFSPIVAAVARMNKRFGDVFELAKTICEIDPIAKIGDLTLVLNDASNVEHGVVVIGFDGFDEKRFVACLTQITAKTDPGLKLVASKAGAVTEYRLSHKGRDPDSEPPYRAAWLANDVVVLSGHKRSMLDQIVASKQAAAGDLAPFLAKADPGAPVFGAALSLGDPTIKGGFATIRVVKGTATLTGTVVAIDAKAAGSIVAEARDGLAEIQRRAKQTAPAALPLLASFRYAGKNAEVLVEASSPLADLPLVVAALDKVF